MNSSRKPLVVLTDASVELGGRLILRDINWSLHPGQHWVIVGRNGSGKSTFLRLVRGELWPVINANPIPPRVYHLNGDDDAQFTAVGIKEAFATVSPEHHNRYLQQEWSLRVRDVVRSGVGGGDYAYQTLTSDQRDDVEAVIDLMRVRHLTARNVQELSTGELRRVLIARALAGRPRVLVCDEIGDGLDAGSRATLLEALDDAARAGTQLLVSTHRGNELPSAMTHQLTLEEGRIVDQERLGRHQGRKAFDDWFKHPGTKGESSAPTERTFPATGPTGSRPAARQDPGPALIEIHDADVYLGTSTKPTLKGINLEIRQGQHWAVLGPNGSGKSTLLKLIAGDVHPAFGAQVRRFAFTPRNTLWELRARLGLVSPELQSAYRESIPAADVVASGFFSSIGLLDRPSTAQRRKVRQTLAMLGLSALADRNFLELSFGEARRILLARALVKDPALILFDEPFDGLDVPARRLMRQALDQAAGTGATLVVVTHHEEDLPACITNVIQMENGRGTIKIG